MEYRTEGFDHKEFPERLSPVADRVLALSSLSDALRKANGRLLPFGFLYLMRALRKFDTLEFCLAGVRKKYRNMGG